MLRFKDDIMLLSTEKEDLENKIQERLGLKLKWEGRGLK